MNLQKKIKEYSVNLEKSYQHLENQLRDSNKKLEENESNILKGTKSFIEKLEQRVIKFLKLN